MRDMPELTGNSGHQRIQRIVVSRYEADPRVRAIIVFGSLGRGNWDDYSDVDLDIVLADETTFSLEDELSALGAALTASGDPPMDILPKNEEEADIVLSSLAGVSIRFHPLATTDPAILESMTLLSGDLSAEEITAAGRENVRPRPALPDLLGRCVRYVVETDRFLRRGRLWLAIDCLHRFREAAMALYSESHGGARPTHEFEASAPTALQEHLGRTLPQFDSAAIRDALNQSVTVLTDDIARLTAGQVALTDAHRLALMTIAGR